MSKAECPNCGMVGHEEGLICLSCGERLEIKPSD